MTTIGDKLGKLGRPYVGVGIPLAPNQIPQETELFYRQWALALMVSESPEGLSEGAAPVLSDVEVDHTDALIRAAGVTLDENVDPRTATWMFQQANLDFATELVIIDPPFLGYKSSGSFVFVDLSLADTSNFGWAVADVAGVLIFSNGIDSTYTRDAGASVVTDISTEIVAQCFATAFGRVFAGAITDGISGFQALSLAWNAASGAVDDFTGLGAGAELLISNNAQADRVVAMVPAGLETLGILCRKSLWAGYKTGDSNRPADPQLRFPGNGCVSRETAVATPFGIVYLSDVGVCVFDLTNSSIISEAVNALLLPLNYAQLGQYTATFHQTTQRYVLSTPIGLFIYEFEREGRPGRWYYRTFIADRITAFTSQTGGLTWSSAVGTWQDAILTWSEAVIGEENAPSLLYFAKGMEVGYEDYLATDNLGAAQEPVWETRQEDPRVTDVIETHLLEVQYRCREDAEMSFVFTDTEGAMTNVITKTLPNTAGLRRRALIGVSTVAGIGTSMQIQFSETALAAIERVRRVVMPAGTAVNASI